MHKVAEKHQWHNSVINFPDEMLLVDLKKGTCLCVLWALVHAGRFLDIGDDVFADRHIDHWIVDEQKLQLLVRRGSTDQKGCRLSKRKVRALYQEVSAAAVIRL